MFGERPLLSTIIASKEDPSPNPLPVFVTKTFWHIELNFTFLEMLLRAPPITTSRYHRYAALAHQVSVSSGVLSVTDTSIPEMQHLFYTERSITPSVAAALGNEVLCFTIFE